MKTYTISFSRLFGRQSTLGILLIVALLLIPMSVFAQSSEVRSTEVSGELPNANSEHYLALEPAERDGTVTLNFSYGPQNKQALQGKVNFWVLSEEGLKKFQSGMQPNELAVAAGNPIIDKEDQYYLTASFTVTGRKNYTVIVYNDANASASYQLRVGNALLIDQGGQVQSLTQAAQNAPQSVNPVTSNPATSVDDPSKKVATIAGQGQQLYFTVTPTERDGTIDLSLDFNPKDQLALQGKLQFFVFSQQGLSDLAAGARPEAVNLAAGTAYKNDETLLKANFKAVGTQSYTIMVMNRSAIPADFTLKVSGGAFR